jgi:hypothetical protein
MPFKKQTAYDRFWRYAEPVTESGCWLWTGYVGDDGYGVMSIYHGPMKGERYAHRVSYLMHKGDIPDYLEIDHLCRVRCCVNPDHLEAVSCKENTRRSPISVASVNGRKTHCIRGHEFTEENTMIVPEGRKCLTCRRNIVRKSQAKRRARIALSGV